MKKQLAETLLFIILLIGVVLLSIAMILPDKYLLAIGEFITLLSMLGIYYNNHRNQKSG